MSRTARALVVAPALAAVLLAGCDSLWSNPPAGIDSAAMDRGADPCQDFYRYACGGYLDAHPVGPDGAVSGRRYDAFFETERATSALVEQMSAGASWAGAERVRAYYQACEAAAASPQLATLVSLLQLVDAAQPGASLARTLASLHAAGVGALFAFGPGADLMATKHYIASIGVGGMGLPDRDYYLLPEHDDVLKAYRAHMWKLAEAIGTPVDLGLPDAVVNIETALAKISLDPEAARDPLARYHPSTHDALVAALPHFDLAAYLDGAGALAFTRVNLVEPMLIEMLDAILVTTSIEDLRRYLRWRVMESYADTLNDGVIAEEYRFHQGTFFGFTQPLPRRDYCLRSTMSALSWTVSQAYAAEQPPLRQAMATTIAQRIEEATRQMLASAPWLDEPTRAAAVAKLDAMDFGVSAPNDFSPYLPSNPIEPGSFSDVRLGLARASRAQALLRIDTDEDRAWFLAPVIVNAAYSSLRNAINIPAAILQGPLFDEHFDRAVNFGGIGSVVGHEITHGFDDRGRQFDAAGMFHDWWTAQASQRFGARASCVVDAYDAVEALPGAHVSGSLTLGENIADLAGVELARQAYLVEHAAAEGTAPADERTYFLAYAQSWCMNVRPEALRLSLETDMHAPASARVNTVLANTAAFAAAYNCSAGDAMVSPNVCQVW